MENGSGVRSSGPVAVTPPPTLALKIKPQAVDVTGGIISCAQSAVQLVCSNPGCTETSWMDADAWEARVTSAAQRQQGRGWNGDEDDCRPDHGQLACPCGRGWRRRATMPSTSSSPAALAARLDRLQQLRLMRRSEPMLAAGGPGPYHWPPDSDGGPWSGRPDAVQPRLGFCPQTIGAERFRPEILAAATRHRVFSQPETYDATNRRTNGHVYPGNVPHYQLLSGYKLQPTHPLPPCSTLDFGNVGQLAALSHNGKLSSVDMVPQIYSGQDYGRHRSQTGLTPKRPSRPDVVSHDALRSSLNGDGAAAHQRGSSRRDGASPDSMSSDGGSSGASAGSATGRRRPPTGGTGASTGCSRGSIFRQRTAAELAVFRSLSTHCNAYEIQTAGDDAPYGKDRLRTHVLVALSAARRSSVDCVVCSGQLVVYHDFPLLDGLFFESPMKYNSNVRVEPLTIGGLHRQPIGDDSKFYLNAVCLRCIQGKGERLNCRSCGTPWNGSLFVVGNVYLYDVFAATLCCDARLKCRRCGRAACDTDARPAYYSDGSKQVRCGHCRAVDHHYVKPLHALFTRVAKATDHPHASG